MEETLISSSEPPIAAPNLDEDGMDIVTEAHNPKDNKSDSSSASDSDSDEDAQDTLELQNLEKELSTDPANYDAHVQYIKALRKQGDIDKLRQAREAMSALFPLTPAMWQQWIKDEISLTLSSGREDGISAIEKLYERGVSDYLSVSLWYDYLKFVQDYDSSVRECLPSGILKARDLFERALIASGLHVAEGSKIWEAYESYEEAILNSFDKTDSEMREKQVQRIRNIFHRHLSVPHGGLRSTLLTYKDWEAGHGGTLEVNSTHGISPLAASTYQKALDMLSTRTDFEERIVRSDVSDTERLQDFMLYLKFEQSSGDPARVKSLYERAIAEFPISSDLWLDYTCYLNNTLKADKNLREIFNRAVRNCPWVGELWVRYLLYLERCGASEKDLSDVFERALLCTFSSLDEYVDIFLTRVDGLRRRTLFARGLDDGLDYALIRDTFQRACDYLSPHLKNTHSLLQIHSYWARLETSIGKDLTAARGVWESLLKNSGSMFEAWQGYISMETEMGNINEARSLYKRCYSKRFSGTGSEDICKLWIRFEREFGTLEDYDHASRKVAPRLQELESFRLQQESKNTTSTDHKEDSIKKNTREKRKPASDVPDEQSPAKRQKDSIVHRKDEAKSKGSVKAKKVISSLVPEGKSHEQDDLKTKAPTPYEPKQYSDQCTAFISNLSLQATSEDLQSFFNDVGGVVAIRILMDKFTKKSRGLAYVDFSDDEHLEAAVGKNKQMLLGKRLSIARSDPKGKRRVSAGNKTSTEKGVAEENREASRPGAQSSDRGRGPENVELKGRNTFAVPRTVRALGWNKPKSVASEEGGDKPKSNEELRNLLLKKT